MRSREEVGWGRSGRLLRVTNKGIPPVTGDSWEWAGAGRDDAAAAVQWRRAGTDAVRPRAAVGFAFHRDFGDFDMPPAFAAMLACLLPFVCPQTFCMALLTLATGAGRYQRIGTDYLLTCRVDLAQITLGYPVSIRSHRTLLRHAINPSSSLVMAVGAESSSCVLDPSQSRHSTNTVGRKSPEKSPALAGPVDLQQVTSRRRSLIRVTATAAGDHLLRAVACGSSEQRRLYPIGRPGPLSGMPHSSLSLFLLLRNIYTAALSALDWLCHDLTLCGECITCQHQQRLRLAPAVADHHQQLPLGRQHAKRGAG